MGNRWPLLRWVVIACAVAGTTGLMSCGDAAVGGTLAPHSSRSDDAEGWSCVATVVFSNGSEYWQCTNTSTPTLPTVITYANVPPPTDPPLDLSCVIACGDASAGGTYTAPAGDPNDGDEGLPALNSWPETEADFDCFSQKCPSARTIIESPVVQKAAKFLYALSLRDGLEHGVFLYLNKDGTIRVGPPCTGEAGSIPCLAYAPPDAIGSIHSHPPTPWYEGPSGPDSVNALFNDIYVVVMSKGWLWILNTNGSAGYQMSRAGTQLQINP
jgi:hypothetical protein